MPQLCQLRNLEEKPHERFMPSERRLMKSFAIAEARRLIQRILQVAALSVPGTRSG
jgi:hypothetical protein